MIISMNPSTKSANILQGQNKDQPDKFLSYQTPVKLKKPCTYICGWTFRHISQGQSPQKTGQVVVSISSAFGYFGVCFQCHPFPVFSTISLN